MPKSKIKIIIFIYLWPLQDFDYEQTAKRTQQFMVKLRNLRASRFTIRDS